MRAVHCDYGGIGISSKVAVMAMRNAFRSMQVIVFSTGIAADSRDLMCPGWSRK
jgi:hypothetical protein